MARIYSETIEITVSRLVREDEETTGSLVPQEIVEQLEAVVSELVGAGVVVEAAKV